MMTAYVPRPNEHGTNTIVDYEKEDYIDIVVDDLIDLSKKMTSIK